MLLWSLNKIPARVVEQKITTSTSEHSPLKASSP